MEINKYLESYQPVLYRTFLSALQNNKLSHAYLLTGNQGTPLKESALFLAKTILCDSPNPMACNNCITCARVDEGNYPDVMVFDGEEGKIKKGDLEKIFNNFDKTALEQKGIMIYVLHLVETMQPIVINSLLKFLEEPGKNIYAFLTTQNEAAVLPTIISRTQVLRFREINRDKIIKDAIESGVNQDDAELLSGLFSDSKAIKEVSESKEYQKVKECLHMQLEAFCESPEKAVYVNQKEIIPVIKTQESAKLYIKLLGEFFKDLLNISVNEIITLKGYANILHEVALHLSNIDKSLLTILSSPKKLEQNVNVSLLLDHIIYKITKEGK